MLSISLLVAVLLVAVLASVKADPKTYTEWCVGNCGSDAITPTQPGFVLMGGGEDTEEAFLWQINKANGGDFLVMRATGTDAYNPWIYDMAVSAGKPLNSVRTLLFTKKDASSDPYVLSLIQNAEAIFFAGGDQSDYINLWANTPVQSLLQSKISSVSMGGTSAGCAIEGNWIYTGEQTSITSDEAMTNPYSRSVTLAGAFLHVPYLESVLTDTHFVTRDRMGRMLTFAGRIIQDQMFPSSSSSSTTATATATSTKMGSKAAYNNSTSSSPISLVHAIGTDEHTALLLDINTGDVEIVGIGTSYICTATKAPEVCKDKTPLTYTDIPCTRLDAMKKDKYSFASFSGSGVQYVNTIVDGSINDNHYGP